MIGRGAWLMVGLALAAAFGPRPAMAQRGITPLLTGPDPLAEQQRTLGGYVTLEDEVDVFAIYRQGLGSGLDFGARLGFSSLGDGGFHVGGDVRYGVAAATDEFPLAIAVVGGLQATFADRADIVSVPIGASLGAVVGPPERPISLYGLPRLVIERIDPAGGAGPGRGGDDNTELELAVDLDTQIPLVPALLFEAALTLATNDNDEVSLGLGVTWRP